MGILLVILEAVVGIVVLFLIIAALIKKEYHVQSEVIINKNNDAVFDYLKHLQNQRKFNKWAMMDPDARISFTGTDGTIGAVYAWDSDNKNVGKGKQEIKNITEGKRIDSEVRFERPFKNVAAVFIETKAMAENQTSVVWAMDGTNPYPMNIMNLFIPGMLEKDMKESLETLKNNLES